MTVFLCEKKWEIYAFVWKNARVQGCGPIWISNVKQIGRHDHGVSEYWQHFGNFCNRYTSWVAVNVAHIEDEIRSYSAWVSLTWSPTHTSLEFPWKPFLGDKSRNFRKIVDLRQRLYARLCLPNCFINGNIILSIKGFGTLQQNEDTCHISCDRPWLLLAPMKYGP